MTKLKAADPVEPNQMTEASKLAKAAIRPELRKKANDFLNSSKRDTKSLKELVDMLTNPPEDQQQDLYKSVLLTLEVVFKNLLKRGDIAKSIGKPESKNTTEKNNYQTKFREQYDNTWSWLLERLGSQKKAEAGAALSTSMVLLSAEANYPIDETNKILPMKRLKSILQAIVSAPATDPPVIEQFRPFAKHVDLLEHVWELMPQLGSKPKFVNTTYALNYLALINVLEPSKAIVESELYFCQSTPKTKFSYEKTRKSLNQTWQCLLRWCDNNMNKQVHRQMLIVLLEVLLSHIAQPILLTDFLMDSLSHGGAISLLALHGIFTLMQKHNITYPDVYEKLYSLFEPEVFQTKYKPRLFYLADLFLSSTHLPEKLVAAFVKRAARLSLQTPPQDTLIVLHFITNLVLRHPNLKCLIAATSSIDCSVDPFLMDEPDPVKSCAFESSLWEITLLQKHALPSVASAARSFFSSLPTNEFNLATVLEVKESEIFDEETNKKLKQFALSYERPTGLNSQEQNKFDKYWQL